MYPNFRHVDTNGEHKPKSANVVVNEFDTNVDDDVDILCCEVGVVDLLLLPSLISLPPVSPALLSIAGCFRFFENRLDMVAYHINIPVDSS